MGIGIADQVGQQTGRQAGGTDGGVEVGVEGSVDRSVETAVREKMAEWGRRGGLARGARVRAGLVKASGKAAMCIRTRCAKCGQWCDSVRKAGEHCRKPRAQKKVENKS